MSPNTLAIGSVAFDLPDVDCLAREFRGIEAQEIVARLFCPDGLPGVTRLERQVRLMVREHEEHGPAGIAARIASDAPHRKACGDRPACVGRFVRYLTTLS